MILLLVCLALAAIFAYTGVSAAPWVPARAYDVEALLDDVRLQKGEVFYELGCGDGRLVRAAAKRGAHAVGYELNPLLWCIAWFNNRHYKNAKVILGNLWRVDLSRADVVMAFLVDRTVVKLEQKAGVEMKKKARLVSYIFPLPHKKPARRTKSWIIYEY